MRLESIKLVGFKSFVDPTTLAFPSNLTAIVGPNGCGKSNIIDAIRWVMGESSAKQLRGQSLDDVIFNGCTTRKPLSQATIELHFDNSDAGLGGQYSGYAQLCIRREITREGQSTYSLNGTRCRRRDIRDIFLGTGLSPRSYAIIEQGMISQLIDAQPDELRAYVEEAAGISLYKERRRETKNRLEHTQENLNRLQDLNEELTKQAKHLQRQNHAAERYKTLKQEERLLKAQLHAWRYRLVNEQQRSQCIAIAEAEAQLHASQHNVQQLLTDIAQTRAQETSERTDCHALQDRYYACAHQVTRLEEKLDNQMLQFEQDQREATQLTQKNVLLEQHAEETQGTSARLHQELIVLDKEWELVKASHEQHKTTATIIEQQLKNWHMQWDTFQENFSQLTHRHRTANTQSQYYQQQCQHLKKRFQRLEEELAEQHRIVVDDDDTEDLLQTLHDAQEQQRVAQAEQELINQQINGQRSVLQQLAHELDSHRSLLQKNQGQTASLVALQEEALGQGQRKQSLWAWLEQHHFADHPRLAQLIQVEQGWERAVEVALQRHIQAVCLLNCDSLDEILDQSLPHSPVHLMIKSAPCQQTAATFMTQLPLALLSTKLTSPWPLDHLLVGVYAAATITEALQYTQQLRGYESIMTREGICLANHWLSIDIGETAKTGLLQRERDIRHLRKETDTIQAQIDEKQARYTQQQERLQQQEEKQLHRQTQFSEIVSYQANLKARYHVKEDRLQQAEQRIQGIQQEQQEMAKQIEEIETTLQHVEHEYKISHVQLEDSEKRRDLLLCNKTTLQAEWEDSTQKTNLDQTTGHLLELRRQTAAHHLKTAEETAAHRQQQQEQLRQRAIDLKQTITLKENTLTILKQQLETQREQRDTLATQLKKSQNQLHDIETHIKHQEQQIQTLEKQLTTDRHQLEQCRLQCQALQVRATTLLEQLQEEVHDVDALINTLPDNLDTASCEARLTEISVCIEHIGAINLAAADEYQAVLERKTYLDNQCQDLTAALETLQTAIQKMDHETRHRFKETFDKINQNFMILFPRLFSGGTASLQLQNPDLLSSGICVMAQPPGKRNGRIQLLSGGEKALTAMALVFSFFQLNPAPFCMLDEIDAPLDDVNVLKFCKLVQEMSKEVQFIFISHNKVAIEMAQHLAGVTMHEPGVSRLVAVDIERVMTMVSE